MKNRAMKKRCLKLPTIRVDMTYIKRITFFFVFIPFIVQNTSHIVYLSFSFVFLVERQMHLTILNDILIYISNYLKI